MLTHVGREQLVVGEPVERPDDREQAHAEPGGEQRDTIPTGLVRAAAPAQPDDRLSEEERRDSREDNREHGGIVPLEAELADDDHALHLVRALADLEDLLVAVEP